MDTYKDPAGTAENADAAAFGALDGMPEAEEDNSDIEDISAQIMGSDPSGNKDTEDKASDAGKDPASVRQFRKGRKKKWVKVLIILLIIAAIVFMIVRGVLAAKSKAEEALAGNIQEETVKRMDITKAISATGTIRSKDIRTLTSPLAGVKIDEVLCKVGDTVEKGSVVVTFSRDDINKKIGQLEEDITEANESKKLDGGDRTNTYVNNNDLETYNIAVSYEGLKRAEKDLQTAKDDLQKVCDEKAEFKRLNEEAKENIDGVQEELIKASDKLAKEKAKEEPDTEKVAELTNEVASLNDKIGKYRDAIDNYDTKIKNFEDLEQKGQNSIDSAQRNYDDAFVKFNKSGYDASFNGAKYDYNLNKGNLTADDNIKNLQRQMEERVDSLENYIITAPISGLVTEVNAQEGNGYQATTGALMTIQAVDVLEVTTQIDEYDINNVTEGQKVIIMTDATGEDELEGKVTFISPLGTAATGNNTSNTFEVRVDILNKDERLRLGMSAKLNLVIDSHDDVLAVPYDAIEEEDGVNYVYVKEKTNEDAEKEKKNILGIEVIGMDGKVKESTDTDIPVGADGKIDLSKKGRKVPVQIGLEGDYYTEVISPDVKEGMTVFVNSKAGELTDDMLMMGM